TLDVIWGPSANTSEPYLNYQGPILPDDERWPQAIAEGLKYADLYEALRQAGRMKGLGATLSDRYDPKGSMQIVAEYPPDSAPLLHNSIHESSYPFWRVGRVFIRMLTTDFHIAM